MTGKRTCVVLEKKIVELELKIEQFQFEAAKRKQAEEMLEQSQQLLQNIINISPFHVVCLDSEGKYIVANKSYCESFERKFGEIIGLHYSQVLPPQLSEKHRPFIDRALSGETVEFEDSNPPGSKIPQYAYGVYTPFGNENGDVLGCVVYVVDITDRKKAEIELHEEKNKLEIALNKVKKLSGLLPICSICKKIRDDKGYWNQIEAYIRDHSEAEFSHSICQNCAKKYYPDIDICEE